MKKQMADRRKRLQEEVRRLKKQRTAAQKERDDETADWLDKKIELHESRMCRYTATTLPIQFSNHVMVDSALVKRFYNKLSAELKRSVTAELSSDRLTIRHTQGYIELQDLSVFYEEFTVPKGEDFLEDLGITISQA